jgi:hypothetical protein
MYRVLGSEQSSVGTSPISQKFLDQLTTLASQRNQRIVDAKPRIPGLLWTGLLFGGVVLLGLGGFMRLGSVRAHLGLLSAVAVLLGLLLFIVFWLDHPFGNELGVTSEPFEQSLSVFDSIDRGREQACARLGALEPPEPDAKVELEVHVDAGYIRDGVRVGVADAGVHLNAVDHVAGAVRHRFGRGAGCSGDGDDDFARRHQESTGPH